MRSSMHVIFVLITLVTLTFQQERPPVNPNATSFSGVFSLNWTAGYCYAMKGTQNQCDPRKINLWDSKSFTIHGFWPSSATQKNFDDFRLQNVQEDHKLHDQMLNIWPPQTNYPIKDPKTAKTFDKHWLWGHQYDKHGKDVSEILQVLHPEKWGSASQTQLQKQYFWIALNLYNKKYSGLQKIRKFKKSTFSRKSDRRGLDYILTKQNLAELLKIPESHFMAKCQKEDVLSEIHICQRMEKNGLYDLPCTSVQNETIYPLTDSCPKNFKFLSYGSYGRRWQKRVTRHCRCKKGEKDKKQCKKDCRQRCRRRCEKKNEILTDE